MAITLRNKKVEERIRAIGRRTGEGPSAVIARLVEARYQRMRAFLDSLPEPTEEERRGVQEAMDDMYDEDGLPK
jgi:hypothetical protein